jgi:hypothetical protein
MVTWHRHISQAGLKVLRSTTFERNRIYDYHLTVMSHSVARPTSRGLQRVLRVISRSVDFVLKDMAGTSCKPSISEDITQILKTILEPSCIMFRLR